LVESGITPILLPAISSKPKMPARDLTSTPVLSAKIRLEKSAIFMRDSETVVDPHSMSAVPSAMASNRVRVSTCTQRTVRSARPSSRRSELATRSQSSIE
jgi:hypothetical protein